MSGSAAGGRRLGAAQLGVWYAQRLDPDSSLFNMGGYLDILGPADAELLMATVTELVAEDETTRLRFAEVNGEPLQQLAPAEKYRPGFSDLSHDPDPAGAAQKLMRRDMLTVPDLERSPLFHHRLFQLNREHFIWYYRAHHLMQDGYSGQLLQRRAGEIYTRLAGGPATGAPLGSFQQLLNAYESYESSPARDRDEAYWRRTLAGLGTRAARGPAGGPGRRLAREVSDLDRNGFDRLRTFARRAGVSWQEALITAVALQQYGRTGDRDVLLSLPVTGRRSVAERRVPGMAANVLPLRLQVDPGATCEELAASVAAAGLRAQWHQRCQATAIRQLMGWQATGSRQFGPAVNIMVDDEEPSFAGIPTVPNLLSTGGTSDQLSITFTRGTGGGLRIDFTVDAACADTTALAAQRREFHHAVEAMTDRPGVRVGDIGALPAADRTLILQEWSGGPAETSPTCVKTLFERQAGMRPAHPALITEAERLSYGELNGRANALAHHLRECEGIGPGDLVAVAHEGGAGLATALLAVAKAGAVCVRSAGGVVSTGPVRDTGSAKIAALLVDHPRPPAAAGAGAGAGSEGPLVCLNDLSTHLLTHSVHDLPTRHTPDSVACLTETGPSTLSAEEHRHVLTTHRALTAAAVTDQGTACGADDIVVPGVSPSSCEFAEEFWGTLARGGTLVLQPGPHPDPSETGRLAAEHRATVLHLTPLLFARLAQDSPAAFANAHTVRLAGARGAPLPPAALARLRPGARVITGHGAPETTGTALAHHTATGQPPAPLPLGTPRAGRRAYVLDPRLLPVPVGAVGELYLGGEGIAFGYDGRPADTATRFVPDPFGAPGTRLYRTGHRARWSPDGVLRDAQGTQAGLTTEGFTVEPAVVEAALLSHPDVAQVLVRVLPDEHGSAELTAYVILTGDAPIPPAALRDHVGIRLPDPLVPSHVLFLERLPLNPRGELDETLLPVPGTAAGGTARTALTEALAGIFTDVLGASRPLSADDNFFKLGGHSLLASRLARRVRGRTGVSLTLRDVFQCPTPAALAHRVESLASGHTPTPARQPERPTPAAPTRPALRRRTQAGVLIEP